MSEAAGLLGGHAHFVHWGVVQISFANLFVIALMVVVFVLALLVRFPHADSTDDIQEADRDVSP